MKLKMISFTKKGMELSQRIYKSMPEAEISLFTKCSFYENQEVYVEEPLGEWTQKQFETKGNLLFIGACGIAVRAIAPSVKSKLCDSGVLVMDELGNYVIPILSGHVGGANELAEQIAEKTGALAVITTATDLNKTFAVDLFAKKNHLTIWNKEGIAKVSAKVLAGELVTCAVAPEYLDEQHRNVPKEMKLMEFPPRGKVDVLIGSAPGNSPWEEASLYLVPQEYVIGVGCKKGKEWGAMEQFLKTQLRDAGVSIAQIEKIGSIDLKAEEPCLLQWSQKWNIPFETYSGEMLKQVEGTFTSSAFVEAKTGVDNVCERAALLGCGTEGVLVYPKHAEDGMTIAIAKKKRSVFGEE